MNKPDTPGVRKRSPGFGILRALFLYVLVPFLLLWLPAKPIRNAVRLSDPAAFMILLGYFGAVGLNWLIYSVIRGRRPSLLVYAHGVLYLLIVVIVLYEALPASSAVSASTLAAVGGAMTLAFLLLLSSWLASRKSRIEHAAAVCLRIIFFVILFFMTYQVIRDIESKLVSRDTWITIGILAAAILAFNSRRILSAFRRSASRRRASGMASGRIVQVIGETYLDRDGDLVTKYLGRIRFTVDGVLFETRTRLSWYIVRKYGKEALVGRAIPVYYDPADPDDAFTNRIGKHFFDQERESFEKQEDGGEPA